ncbi:MAG: hypothetical protein KAG43_10210, partial [Candidatus Marithrix sp.]|nr:hypothetical protein [Candidatus Marithrix sp.]
MQITGYWYPADSSARYDAELSTDNIHYTIIVKEHANLQGMVSNISVSDRLGNIPRKITLVDRSIFETQSNDEIDFLLKKINHKDGSLYFLHILETNLLWITTAFILTVVISFAGVRWGLPWASEKLAYAMPIEVSEQISDGTLELLDKYILEPSALSKTRQQAIQESFSTKLLS